jgi:hypothetical protein
MENQEKNIRCTISLTTCAGGYDPETPGYWDLNEHEILIDILDQGTKEENEKLVLEKLNEGEFTIELNEGQDGIEEIKKLFNKENVIEAMKGSLTSELAPGIILSNFIDDLRSDLEDCCFDIYVMEYGREDEEDEENEYPHNINEEAFSDIWSGFCKYNINFEELKS